jgi:type IV secretion system protein VirB4
MLALGYLRDTRPGLPDLLNWAFPIANGVVINKDGSLLAAWFYAPPDLDASPDTRLNWVSERINDALSRLGGGWAIWVDAVRIPAPTYFERSKSYFPDPVSAMIDEERRAHFTSADRHYETEYVLTVQYMPPIRTKGWLVNLIYEQERDEPNSSAADAILAGFERTLMDLEDSLSSIIELRRMRDFEVFDAQGSMHRRSHLINYLNFVTTGQHDVSLNLQSCGFYLDTVLGGQEFFPGDTPKVGESYVAVVAIIGFPEASVPGILSGLDLLPIPLRYSSRFIFIDQPEAKRQITSLERKWKQRLRGFWADVLRLPSPRIDQDALDMTMEAGEALARTNSALVGTGYYTGVVVLMAPTPAEAIENARIVQREIRNLGFNTRIETINATEAWLGSLPGHAVPNVRRPPMHTDNLADLLPLTGVWTGSPTNPSPFYPSGSPALLQAATTGAAPFWLNLQVGDVGHTLIFGPTGAGKSVLQAMIMVQALRYPGMTIWAFDKGRSALAVTKACGGVHYEIDTSGELAFCPLSVLETDTDAAWAEEWIAVCYELQHGSAPIPSERNAVHQAISRMRASNGGKSLTHFCAEVQSPRVRDAMSHYTLMGPLGRLLDSEEDGLRDGRLITFEIEELMSMGNKQSIPVLLYLFRRLEKSLRGQPALLQLAEAWIMLGHPVFRDKIREWLKVLRKANCAVILDTQSLSDASRSGILDVLTESCPTKIFLPNGDAGNVGTPEFPGPAMYYRGFGLNDTHIEIIRSAIPKRHYYVVSPSGCRLIELQLGPVALAFVATGSKEQIARVLALSARHGERWPHAWLEEQGSRA